MVFESLVVDLLNKYLGQYVKNLDPSQLKIGIWGGNVELENLELKDTALDDLDLPIKVVRGYLGKLILGIPWKNLYTESTVVNIEDLHLVAKPNFDIKYNEEREEKSKAEKKQKQIENIEEARKREEEKKRDKSGKSEESDGFAQKLATNVIKNLQVTIKNIHIRYEDSVSDVNGPFSIGITMEGLSAQTTDSDFIPKIIKDSVTIIHKLVKLDNFAVYWNPGEGKSDDSLATQEWLKISQGQIRTRENRPNMRYILSPMVASQKMKINTKPGMQMDIPQMFMGVVLEELGIVLQRSQYHGVVQLLESFERMNRNQPFKKYRPMPSEFPLIGNVKLWWSYCITSVLEEDVRRRMKMWSWESIKKHRDLCKQYKAKYKEKVKNKSPPKALIEQLENMENVLNIASITIFRRLAESEALQEKKEQKEKGGFFGFFTRSKTKEPSAASKIEELMGSDAKEKEREMQKLYDAIGYSENEVITPFPKQYVAVVVEAILQKLSLKIIEDTNKGKPLTVIHFSIDHIILDLQQRPSAQAIRAAVKIGQMKLYGTPTIDDTPLIIKNMLTGKGQEFLPLVDFVFETNPLQKPDIDQCITAICQPLEIIYDANTIDKLIAFSEPPQHVILQDLQDKAYSTFEDFKVSSTAGLLHAMETRTIMDIDIQISSSHLIIPDTGAYSGCTDMILIDFGSFYLKSDPSQVRNLNPKDIDNIDEVQSKAYDRFLLKLTRLQILLCRDGDDFRSAKKSETSSLHILHPIEFDGKLAKAVLPNDPRLKQICVSGDLSSLWFSVSDDKVARLIKLADSLPLPAGKDDSNEPAAMKVIQKALSLTSLVAPDEAVRGGIFIPIPVMSSDEDEEDEFVTPPDCSILTLQDEKDKEFQSGIANQVKVELNFTLKQLKLAIALTDKQLQTEKECMEFIVDDVCAEISLRRWDMFVNADIGRLVLNEMTWGDDGEPLQILSTPKDTKMLKLAYRHCGFNEGLNLGPSYFFSEEAQLRALHFRDEFQATEQMIDVQLATLYLVMHQEALLSLMSLVYQVMEPLNKKDAQAASKLKRSISAAGSRISLSIEENERKKIEKRNVNSKSIQAAEDLKSKVGLQDEKKMKVTATLDGVGIMICSAKVDLAQAYVKGLSAHVLLKDEKMEIKAHMRDMQVQDNIGVTNYKKIVSMQTDQVFDLEIVVFENGTKGSKQFDMTLVDTSVKLSIGQMRVVFLYRFIQDLLNFVDNFEDAKNAVIEASIAAKDKAVEAASEFSKHSSRVQLNVVLRAPTIVVPVGSSSNLALLVDLGELRVFNNFKLVNGSKSNKNSAITDNMTIRLADLKLLKSLIKDGENVMHQRAIVEPMVLQVGIVRNLTPANHIVPDVSVKGNMPVITLSISEEDIAVALKILQGNIAEGEARVLPKNKKNKKGKGKDSLEVPKDRLADIYEEPEDGQQSGDEAPREKLLLDFDLQQINIKLYLKPPDLTFEDEFLARNDEWLLSLFTIGNLTVNGTIMSDESIKMSVLLSKLTLDDTRPSDEQNLRRMIDYTPEPLIEGIQKQPSLSDSKCMLDLKFEQSSSLDKKIEVSLSNLLCIFNVEFIMKLVQTMLAAIPKDDDGRRGSVSSVDSPDHTSSDEESDALFVENYNSEATQEQKRFETRLQLHVRNPQIVLLADAKDIKTNALFLTTEVNFQYIELDNVQKMLGAVSHTAILSTAFKKEHRSDISTVLSIDNVNIHSSAPIAGKPHMHLTTTLIKLNVSPKTIQTLSACSGHLSAAANDEEMLETQKTLNNLWHIKDFTNKKLWYMDTPPQHVLSAGSFVLARTENGVYRHGFLSKKDSHFTVFFYPEGQISHKVSDVSSVVNDIPPKASDVYIGINVVAAQSKESGFRIGRVSQIWKNDKDQKPKDPSPTEDVDLLENKDKYDKYLVTFYHDNSESYYLLEEMRVVSRSRKGNVPGVGANVYARYHDGYYYHGMTEKVSDFKVRVNLHEIGEEIEHDIDDSSAVILNMTPLPHQVKKHFKVIASKSETSKGYHPGKVLEIQGSPGFQSYGVKFEDGTRNQVPITKLLSMPKAPYDALPEVGTYVYSRVSRDAPLYEKGIVAEKKDRICVKHLNGRKLAHEIQNIHFVVRNIVPQVSSLRVGQEVIAQADSDDQKMFLATIKDIAITDDKSNKKFLVQFTDGAKKRLTPGRIRILSTYGNEDDTAESNELNVARKEQLVVEVEGISFRVEGYLGGLLTPMLKVKSKLTANVKNWSSKMTANAFLSVQATYYNDEVAEWEPLVEPVIEKNRERPWQLSVDYMMEDDNMACGDSNSNDAALLQKPEATVKIESVDNLEITLSKSCIALLGDLGKVFGEAVESIDILPQVLMERQPFLIKNDIGKKVIIKVNELLKGSDDEREMQLEIGASVGLINSSDDPNIRKNKLPTISIEVEGFHEIKDIVVKRQRSVIYDLVPKNLISMASEMYSVVIEVTASDGQRIITIRSPLQVKNHFPIPLDVSYVNKDNKSIKLSTVESGAVFSIPLIPTYNCTFHLKPAGFGYGESTECLNWSALKNERQKQFVCFPPAVGYGDPFFIQVVTEEDVYTSIHGMIDVVPKYTMHCYPPIILHNYLPYPIKYKIKGMGTFDNLVGGANWPLFTINVEEKPSIEIELLDYVGCKWTGHVTISSRRIDSSKPVTFVLESADKKLELGVYFMVDGALNVTLYAPYWLLNKTGKTLVYKAVGSSAQYEHPESYNEAIMLFVKGKQKKAKVCLKDSGWSSDFSLDTIGSGGSVKSEGIRGRMYEMGVGISLSYFGLTKIVTFTPLRMITNHTKYKISMAEYDSDVAEWHTVNSNESIPYWPTTLPLKNLYLNINGIDSVKFNPEPGKKLLLKFQNQIGGVCLNYQEKDSSSVISFTPYFDGAAPVRIENLCKKISMISYKQVDKVQGNVLTYGQSVLYTWVDPTAPHELVCGVIEAEESETKIKLDINDFGRMKMKDGAVYWVSFLDGLQRVLLFTDNFKSAYSASQEKTLRPTIQVNFDIESLGLSLVNVDRRVEVAYLAIRQSPIVWEQFKKNRWKPLPMAMSDALEDGYTAFDKRKGSSKDKIMDREVDFEKMFITKPEKIRIRRTYHSGLGMQYTISPNRMQVRATISSIQLDSHIPGSTFLTVIHVVKPPKSIASEHAPKPFFELSLTTSVGDKNVVNEINYFKVLIQEIDVRIDKGFLLGLMELFSNEKIRGTEKERYAYDMSQVGLKFEDSPEFQAAKQDRHYVFSYFHLSPLKIHVSFSMTGGHGSLDDASDDSRSSLQGNVLSLLLQSVGVAFTEIQDVEFKLACFEVEPSLLSKAQLTETIGKHYQNQAIKQLYVLVLGLDVLGNPYGLITGVGAGAKNFFYEPYQGLIQGPEEFAEGLAYGVKSLVGGTVGGVSGAVSKITGTVGKGLAALTMDDEYQQKRRQAMSQRPTNLGQGLAKGGKGLVKGIVSGVTGVVTKPYEGAKEGGATGFVKGFGKGLLGVVARPAGGVVDMASSTFEGLKSTTSGVKSVAWIRISRVFHADKVLRPFNDYEADGNKVLMECDKGAHAKTDFYMAHVYPANKKNYLILSDKCVMCVGKSEILNDWESDWIVKFTDFKGAPEVKENNIIFPIHNMEKRKSIFKKSSPTREVTVESNSLALWFLSKIKDAKLL